MECFGTPPTIFSFLKYCLNILRIKKLVARLSLAILACLATAKFLSLWSPLHQGHILLSFHFHFHLCYPILILIAMLLLAGCRICVIAGNISPIDVITHVPILCEEADIPYVYVPSKEVSCLYPALICYGIYNVSTLIDNYQQL